MHGAKHHPSGICIAFLTCLLPVTALNAAPLVGDFDGDGYTDVGLWDPVRLRALLDSTNDGRIDGVAAAPGISTDLAFMGDWDGDGVETLALYRRNSNQVIWCNSNSACNYSVRSVNAVGTAGGIPVKGDWNGDGQDGFALYDIASRTFVFYESMSSTAFATWDTGNVGDLPVSGDWNQDGYDSIGLFRPSTREFWLYDTMTGAPTMHVGSIGNPGDLPIFGKWHGFAGASLGLYRPSTSQFIHFNLNGANLQVVSWLDPLSAIETDGRQLHHTSGVPHTDSNGVVRTSYSAVQSFLPRGIYYIWNTFDEHGTAPENALFPQLQAAGFNVALTWPTITVSEALQAAAGSDVKIVPRFSQPEFAAHDSNPGIFAWHVDDEPNNDEIAAIEATFSAYQGQAIHTLYNTIAGGTPEPLRSRVTALGNVLAVDQYPITRDAVSGTTLENIAENVTALRVNTAATGKPLWFVAQAFRSNQDQCVENPSTPQRECDLWEMPLTNPDHYRAMAYTAFVHGASGLFAFGWDSKVMREGGNFGITPTPRTNYPGCTWGGYACEEPSPTEIAQSQALWSRVAALNGELGQMKSVLLSPTSTAAYSINLLQTPNLGSSPIRTILKTTPSGTYLIAVNMINDNLDAVFQLQSPVSSVSVQFENRTVPTPLWAIRDHFGPFAVHIYKW
jgi:hypothetical protein